MNELLFYPERNYVPAFGFASAIADDEKPFVERIAAAYRRERACFSGYGDSLWQAIDQRRATVDHVLMTGSAEEIHDFLEHPGQHDLLYGYENTFAEYTHAMRADQSRQQAEARWIHDALARLAEALNAVRASGPEAPQLNVALDAPALVAAIEARHGRHIEFPNPFEDEFGIETGRGKASLRAIHAIYQAFRVNAMLTGSDGRRVIEIGAGLGRTAFYCATMFAAAYTIYDLPITNVSQAFFLGQLLGPDRIALAGEVYDPSRHAVRILSINHKLTDDDRFDLVLNVDSLTEMDRNHASAYVEFALRNAKAFLSINHEAHSFAVADLLAEKGARHLRFPYWMRKGYVEEIWTRPGG